MTATVRNLNQSVDGEPLQEVVLDSGEMSIHLLNIGASIWQLSHRALPGQNLVLHHQDPAEYAINRPHFGCTVGPVANRITGARFTLDGEDYQLEPNEGANQLHGGPTGFGRKTWIVDEVHADGPQSWVRFRLNRPAGEGGYPGDLQITATYELVGERLRFSWSAVSDAPTPVSLTNHTYWNLNGVAGAQPVDAHWIRVSGDRRVEVDDQLLPTGQLRPVAATPYHLTEFEMVSTVLDRLPDRRIDDCYVGGQGVGVNQSGRGLGTGGADAGLIQAAIVGTQSGIRLDVDTSLPGLQVYSGHMLEGSTASGGFGPYAGLCLETQHLPDAVNQPDFPSSLVRPGEMVEHWTTYEFSANPPTEGAPVR